MPIQRKYTSEGEQKFLQALRRSQPSRVTPRDIAKARAAGAGTVNVVVKYRPVDLGRAL
jgi:hypothetical protein